MRPRLAPHNGARVVAKAWVDPDFRRWLLTDTTAAIASLGYGGRQGETMVALENTDPRGVLHDFGVELSADTQIRVWGFHRGAALSGRAEAPGRHRRLEEESSPVWSRATR
jgi:Nitrile hydratase, alpha chain